MDRTAQIKVGRELISNSQEAWLGYYVFAGATLTVLGGGFAILRRTGLTGTDYGLALLGVLILAAVCLGICIMCHILGHIVDALDEIRRTPDGRRSSGSQSDG